MPERAAADAEVGNPARQAGSLAGQRWPTATSSARSRTKRTSESVATIGWWALQGVHDAVMVEWAFQLRQGTSSFVKFSR